MQRINAHHVASKEANQISLHNVTECQPGCVRALLKKISPE